MKQLTVGLLNDSFPPTIDGVANVTVNYARIIDAQYGAAVVATPYYPHVQDKYSFEVLRYPSTYLGESVGYRAGYPFDPHVLHELEQRKIDIIHTHCPFVSTVLARMLRKATGVPIVFTYHTKFDIDLEDAFANDMLRKASVKFILNNINACDEVWVVSEGAGQNLRGLGYQGDYIIMENGTDFDRRRADRDRVEKLRAQLGIPQGLPVMLFVGRLRWYKGIQISLDGLRAVKEQGQSFRFLLVGDGADRAEIAAYIAEIGLTEECILTGAVADRELLRDYFTLADLFLFPSTFDTNGIVVREAAACSLPSVVIRDSAAAEGITDGQNGILIEETAAAMCAAVLSALRNLEQVRKIGEQASRQLYLSWEDAVGRAYARYLSILERYPAKVDDKKSLTEALGAAVTKILDDVAITREQLEQIMDETKLQRLQHREQNKLRRLERTDKLGKNE